MSVPPFNVFKQGRLYPNPPTSQTLATAYPNLQVTWVTPTTGRTPTGYKAIVYTGSSVAAGTVFETLNASGAATTSATTSITPVFNTRYIATVQSSNAEGAFSVLTTTANILYGGVPAYSPASVTLTAWVAPATTLTCTWTAPGTANPAYYPLQNYTVQLGNDSAQVVATTVLTYTTTTALTIGTTYTAYVYSTNALGSSAARTSGTTTQYGAVPVAPTDVTFSGTTASADGKFAISLYWTGSADSTYNTAVPGNYSINFYYQSGNTAGSGGSDAGSNQTGKSVYTSGSPFTLATLPNLTLGYYYSAVVTPNNAIGAGATGTSGTVRYGLAPNSPTSVVITAYTSGNTLTVTWAAPTTNSAWLVAQNYYVTLGSDTSTVANTVLTFTTSTALTIGTTYTATVTSTNAIGSSSVVTSAAVKFGTVPPAVTSPSITGGGSSSTLTVTWTRPGSGYNLADTTATVSIYSNPINTAGSSGTLIATYTNQTSPLVTLSYSVANMTAAATATSGFAETDDGYTTITCIPFGMNGTAGYTNAYVGTNGYITFSAGSSVLSGFSGSSPAVPTIFLGGYDRRGLSCTYESGTNGNIQYTRIVAKWYPYYDSTGGLIPIEIFLIRDESRGNQYILIKVDNGYNLNGYTAGFWGLTNGSSLVVSSTAPAAGSYLIYKSTGYTGASWSEGTSADLPTMFGLSILTIGSYYSAVITSKNVIGNGTAATTGTVKYGVVPGIVNLAVSVTGDKFGNVTGTVTTQANTSTAAPITSYIWSNQTGANPGTYAAISSSPTAPVTISNLPNGSYTFRVYANNTIGSSETYLTTASVSTYTGPAAPTGLTIAENGSGSLILSWTAATPLPAVSGGTYAYTLYTQTVGGSTTSAAVAGSGTTVTTTISPSDNTRYVYWLTTKLTVGSTVYESGKTSNKYGGYVFTTPFNGSETYWSLPDNTTTYKITVAGAAGGTNTNASGGKGAKVTAIFSPSSLSTWDKIVVRVGGGGKNNSNPYYGVYYAGGSGGGGGGSGSGGGGGGTVFATRYAANTAAVVCAGGGGGASDTGGAGGNANAAGGGDAGDYTDCYTSQSNAGSDAPTNTAGGGGGASARSGSGGSYAGGGAGGAFGATGSYGAVSPGYTGTLVVGTTAGSTDVYGTWYFSGGGGSGGYVNSGASGCGAGKRMGGGGGGGWVGGGGGGAAVGNNPQVDGWGNVTDWRCRYRCSGGSGGGSGVYTAGSAYMAISGTISHDTGGQPTASSTAAGGNGWIAIVWSAGVAVNS